MRIVKPSAVLIAHTPAPEVLIEMAGRTCYKSEDKINEDSAPGFVERMVASGHHSTLEHASATFRVVCDRGVSHEIVRHRIGMSYSQESTRYCNYAKDKFDKEITVIEPPGLGDPEDPDGGTWFVWKTAMNYAELYYAELIKKGVKAQIARGVLPNSLKTEIVITGNFTSWRHFLSLRLGKKAHPQMRQIAYMIWHHLKSLSPACFDEFFEDAQAILTDRLISVDMLTNGNV